MPPVTPKTRKRAAAIPFPYKLVLNQWILSLFETGSFSKLSEGLKDERLEGLDESGIHRFYNELTARFFDLKELPNELLLSYEQNIARYTKELNEARIAHGEQSFRWKYFQWLSLLFTEIYLDWYFNKPAQLIATLNLQIEKFNEGKADGDQILPLDATVEPHPQLNKLAYWMATGSGKTLLMHVNIMQFRHYFAKYGNSHKLNRIMLLTPNEGLSKQHYYEFEKSGMSAELFSGQSKGLFAGTSIEIIDINKLREQKGDKTFAVESFEGNNLVLVDEGHRGASGGEGGTWMQYRDRLCEQGFSFEYSATFGQAVKSSKELTDRYAKCILFDYSYKYFYGDGFGKEYSILNLDEGTQKANLELYLVASLLAFYQQLKLFKERSTQFRPFNLEKPLWVFVGGSVTATLSKQDASDIMEILFFLSRFASDRLGYIKSIEQVLNKGIVTDTGRNIFAHKFGFLNTLGLTPEQIYADILTILFNAPAGGALHVDNLKGAQGEIALRLGDTDPFGVINVGDAAGLCKLCEEKGKGILNVGDKEFSGSLFQVINNPTSSINLLIGSRKFTEGWNSYRVSTMGLMNIGKSEGSQIIQLFGRGVRLRGYNINLKRSSASAAPTKPQHILSLETLNIFGIHADYMAEFKKYLEEEGLPANENQIEFLMPVIKNLGTKPLKVIRLKKKINGVDAEHGDAFKRMGPIPSLGTPDSDPALVRYFNRNRVTLNWYPKIQSMQARGVSGTTETILNTASFTPEHLAFLPVEEIYYELQDYKNEQSWFNFNISKELAITLLQDTSWYTLQIPAEEMRPSSFAKMRQWQEIAVALLKKYCERYYLYHKAKWEQKHLEYQTLEPSDPNFPEAADGYPDGAYRILIEESKTEIIKKLEELRTLIQTGKLRPWEFSGIKTILFEHHLYQPLFHLENGEITIRPVELNKGEAQFVEDLRHYCDANKTQFEKKELYLLRNLSKGRGVGFFEQGNFHPDFILWLLHSDKQFVTFIDPKGIRNLGFDDPKIRFYSEIKDLEQKLGDPAIILNSVIVSNTPSSEMHLLWNKTKIEMEVHNILFQEDGAAYISKLLSLMK